MRHLDGVYTQKFNRVHHRDGPLFRGRYKAILIDAQEYFRSLMTDFTEGTPPITTKGPT